jgi:hypothetical protein
MTYETLQYVDGSGTTQEVALSIANLGNGPAVRVRMLPKTHAWSEMEIAWLQPPETGIAIPFKSRCIVYANRASSTGAANSFSGGSMLFQGRRVDNEGSASATRVLTSVVLGDALWDLSKITFQIVWKYMSGGTYASPTFSNFNWPDIVLFMPAPGTTYSPAPVNNTITTWQQILDIINYSTGFISGADAVALQVGGSAEFTTLYCNWYPIRAVKCLDALLMCLRPHPGVFTEVDYTTTPPTIHFRNRANLTAATLPYKSTDVNGIVHVASDIKSLDELVPDAVRLYYKINGTFNGQPVVNFATDIYPAAAPNSLLCLDYSIDITGAAQTETIYNFTSYAFDPTSKDLWREKVPSLKQISQGGQITNDGGAGALAILDTTINGGGTHPDGLQVVDKTGAAINLATYLYYTDQPVYSWMTLSGGSAASTVGASTVGFFSYTRNTGGALNLTPKVGRHSHSMRLKLTNAPSGTYALKQTINTGEVIPTAMAQSVYTELGGDLGSGRTPQWKLRHEIAQIAASSSTLPAIIKPGKHKINLSGGAAAWTTMNAVPQNVTIEFLRVLVNKNDGTGSEWRLAARHTIACGPVNHLEPGYLVQLTNLFWNRNRSGIDAYQRLTGVLSSSQIDLSAEAARENSIPANPDHSQQIIYAPDAADATRSIAITHDATTGQIQVAQVKSADGSNYTNGIIAPHYKGSGPPSASTLASNAYYRLFDYYLDIANPLAPNLWICVTAGDKTSSVWYSFTQC